MAKPKGHRANKPNDSFGTINSETLYRGKYRDEVYVDEDENTEEGVEAADPSEEATPNDDSFVQDTKQKEDEHDYKKRYDDLKRHYDSKVNEFKKEVEDLRTAVKSRAVEMPEGVRAPQTQEELEEFKERYPDVFEMVQSVSSVQTEAQVSQLREELEQIKEREKELEKQKAYEELLRLQPDFNELKSEQKFLDWLEEQPASISDGIYKNNTDARWAARVVDLYKADTGSTKKQSKKASAAEAITKTPTRDVKTNATDGKKVWKVSEIGRMKPWQFEKFETELEEARAEGRIDYNS
jgi:murein L,D-transpeptidase YcbB/YkuD